MNAFRLSGAALVVASLLALAVGLGGSASGCGSDTYVWICTSPDGGNPSSYVTGDPTPPLGPTCLCITEAPIGVPGWGTSAYPKGDCTWLDGGADAEGPLSGCAGECRPNPPYGWSSPGLLWFGDAADVPGCPVNAAGIGYEGYAGPITMPLACGACSCSTPSGSCGLPVSITASSAPCDGGAPLPFAGPAAWDGGCTAYDAIGAGAQSVTSTPLVLSESGCTPQQAPIQEDLPGIWSTVAIGCTSSLGGTCANSGETCAPSATDGFRECIFFLAGGETDCPSAGISPYTEQHVFFGSANDTRSCSKCTCTPSAASTCSAHLSLYTDDTCGQMIAATTLDATGSLCLPFAPSSLVSKSIGPVTYTPGTCQPDGGTPDGSVMPVDPSTFCCIPR